MNRLYNILNGIINPFGKVLWEGTWSSGSITVNGISKYSLLMMEQAGEPIIVVNDGSVLRGMSMAASGTVHYGRAFSSNISGNTLTLPGENNITQIPHQASGNHGAISRQSITKIVGLVPNWGGYCIAVFSRLSAISSLVRRWRHEQVIQHSECYRIQINDYNIILNVLRTVQVWGSSYRTVLGESSDKIGWGFIRHDSRSVSSKRRSGLHCVQYIGDVFRNNSVQGKWGDCSNIRKPNRWDNKIHCDVHKVALSERGCVA